jgi:hypothetical protein
MNRGTLWIVLLAVVALGVAGCGNSHHVTITTAPTTLTAGASSNVVATVSHSGSAVNWTCLPAGACGSFNPTQTPNGGTSVYTAPPAAPSGGSVTIIATSVAHPSRSASVSVAITGVLTANFVFYASGMEACEGECPYSVAGVATIAQDGSGTVLGGEQDYNDGGDLNVPDDPITGGLLTLANDGSGNATLTITTLSGSVGVDGTETFALNYANPNHALIIQFDQSATSSGSFDLQTSTAAPASASFAFVASGTTGESIVEEGGVIALDGSGGITGTFDRNNNGTPDTNQPIPAGAAIAATDSLGRGVVTGLTGADTNIAYYVVGPEVLRIISIDPDGQAVGSSYGQGTAAGGFSSATLGPSVFSIGNTLIQYAEVGQFNTSLDEGTARPAGRPVREGGPPAACTGVVLCDFFGIDDQNFEGTPTPAQPISGTYSIAANGYGSMTYINTAFDESQTFGVYAVDPQLNILDPNDTTDGLGGALIAEMDNNLVGTGSIVPQTDPSAASFTGNYTFGAQGFGSLGDELEFDFVGSGTVAAGPGAFSGTGSLNDLFGALTDSNGQFSVSFSGTLVADPNPDNTGRYTMNPMAVAVNTADVDTTLYQAEGGQLFWIDMDVSDVFIGSWETQPSAPSDARKAQAKTNIRKQ